jgi:hypothetical protein
MPGLAKTVINHVLAPLGAELVRKKGHDWSDTRNFIPLEETLAGARARGMSVGDYVDEVLNKIPGATQSTIDHLVQLGVFAGKVDCLLEIGPGTGRYLEKELAICSPQRVEIYETARPWAEYLVREYKVQWQPTDGQALSATPDSSCDIVQAFKVFSSISFMPTIRNWAEMVRVARPGGFIVFDIMTENCLAPDVIRKWIASGVDNGAYPACMPGTATLAFFADMGCSLVGSFQVPMGVGTTQTFVFKKT